MEGWLRGEARGVPEILRALSGSPGPGLCGHRPAAPRPCRGHPPGWRARTHTPVEEALGRPAQPVMTQRGRVVAVFHLDLPKVTRPRFNELPTAHWRRGGGRGSL